MSGDLASGPGLSTRPIPRFVGPASVVGVCLGVMAWTLPLLYGGAAYWAYLLPAAGLPLLAVPGARRLGTGLLASALVWPFTVFGFFLIVLLGPVGSLLE